MPWRCPECGRSQPRNEPPCARCGHMRLERVEGDRSDPDPTPVTERGVVGVAARVAKAATLSLAVVVAVLGVTRAVGVDLGVGLGL